MVAADNHPDDDKFKEIIKHTPLVSIGLIIRDKKNRVLLGFRKEDPAANSWFVPRGRIEKNKMLTDALSEISKREIGISIDIKDARCWGIYEHHYDENKFKMAGIKTHYVVIAFEYITSDLKLSSLSKKYHSDWKWVAEHDIGKDKTIHKYTRDFFTKSYSLHPDQYSVAASFREHYNTLVWQTPVISLAAQAFLLSIALNKDTNPYFFKVMAAGLAFLAAICSIQLFFKHRYYERNASELLSRYEKSQRLSGFHKLHGRFGILRPNFLTKRRSHIIWLVLLGSFAMCAGVIFMYMLVKPYWSSLIVNFMQHFLNFMFKCCG